MTTKSRTGTFYFILFLWVIIWVRVIPPLLYDLCPPPPLLLFSGDSIRKVAIVFGVLSLDFMIAAR
ncbi:hypothetical protein LZ31DRAFT_23233 [Colletotrichum somersetense]|nr:hypothetical protein LZ31DRAFT_23233 [Colletotrichum somersetense]